MSHDKYEKGVGCLGATLKIGAIGLLVSIAAVGCSAVPANASDMPKVCSTQANLNRETTICEGIVSASSTGNLEFTIDEARALASSFEDEGCSNQCSTDLGWVTFGKTGGVGWARAGGL